jgi:hypothetical protein
MSNIKSFKQDKPAECIICTDEMNENTPLECGHWIHIECVKKHFKPECPLCRTSLNINVTGNIPINESLEELNQTNITIQINITLIEGSESEQDDDIDSNEEEYIDPHQEEYDSFLQQYANEFYRLNENTYEQQGDEQGDEQSDEEYDEENPMGDNFSYDDY